MPGTDRRVVAMPYQFSAASMEIRRGVARRGEHNAEALSDWLGLDAAAVATLASAGVLIGERRGS
jgi:crotonobetainyl-CoA:carnitine CoA-transferase CaiB-like acyl-CoA transferase